METTGILAPPCRISGNAALANGRFHSSNHHRAASEFRFANRRPYRNRYNSALSTYASPVAQL